MSDFDKKHHHKTDKKDKSKMVSKVENLRTMLRDASAILEDTKSVFTISRHDMPTNTQTAIIALNTILDNNNGSIERKGFGNIQISDRLSSKYITDKSEMVAILAIPDVIKNGIIIGHVENHKKRGYSTVTFGAKINIDEKDAHMAVSVKTTNKNFYTAHRVLLPNGKYLEI